MTEHLPEPAPIPDDVGYDFDDDGFSVVGSLAAVADTGLFGTDEHEPDYVDTNEHVEDDLVFLDDDGAEVQR